MHRPSTGHLLGTAIAITAVGLTAFAGKSLGAAVVGETRHLGVEQKAAAGIDSMKALYRRPASIPFPKDNLYTPQKLVLGKKLYFDTRISVSSVQSCASCHSPAFQWARGGGPHRAHEHGPCPGAGPGGRRGGRRGRGRP